MLPFLRLHGEQAATTFTQVVWPPRERGSRWSKVRSSREPQYWQLNLSRRNTLKRVKAGCVAGFTKVLSETTLGSFISRLGLRSAGSDSATMFSRSRKTALMARCQNHTDSG